MCFHNCCQIGIPTFFQRDSFRTTANHYRKHVFLHLEVANIFRHYDIMCVEKIFFPNWYRAINSIVSNYNCKHASPNINNEFRIIAPLLAPTCHSDTAPNFLILMFSQY